MTNKIKIGLLGLGTVGSAFIKNFYNHPISRIADIDKILLLNLNKSRDIDISKFIVTTNADDILLDPNIDIVIELIGGEHTALNHILLALNQKKAVITANKCVIAKHAKEIFSAVQKNKKAFLYEASVGGGIPILRVIIDSYKSNAINRFIGICNGTSNFILTKMLTHKIDFNLALERAQELGYAEADPSADIDGHDAAHKASILSSLCFKHISDFSKVYIKGISDINLVDLEQAERLGYTVKHIVFGENIDHKLQLAVFPALVNKHNIISCVNNVDNIIQLESNLVGSSSFIGPGAGGDATSSSVLNDLIAVIENRELDVNFYEDFFSSDYEYLDIKQSDFKYFINLYINNTYYAKSSNFDKSKLALRNKLIKIIQSKDININKIYFTDYNLESKYSHIIIFTEFTVYYKIIDLLNDLQNMDYIDNCNYIRVLD